MGDVGEVRIDEEIELKILLKDLYDNCYEDPKRVDIRILGRY
jgi:hypothetical protein